MIKAGITHLLTHDQIGITQDIELVVVHFSENADRQAWPRERMTADDLLRQAQIAAHLAHLVLEQPPQRFHQLELQILGQPADVVVALDLDGDPLTGLGINARAGALDHIGVKGALGQVIEGAETLALRLKHPDELSTDDLAFLLGIGNAGELGDEALARMDVLHIDVEALVKEVHQEFGLTLPHEALVDEHAGELIANRLVQQEGQCGRINPARQSQQHPLVAHLGTHISNRFINEGGRGPVGNTAADVINKITDQRHAATGMHHLRVELHAIKTAIVVRHGRFRGVLGVGQTYESRWQRLHGIAMAHPHRRSVIDVGEQIGGIVDVQRRLAVFSPTSGDHRTTQLLHHQLHAVANPQDRDPQIPELRIAQGRSLLVHRARPAAEDDAPRGQSPQLLGAGGVSHHQREHLGFAHAAGDQFRILGTKIKNDDGGLATRGGGISRRRGHRQDRFRSERPDRPSTAGWLHAP